MGCVVLKLKIIIASVLILMSISSTALAFSGGNGTIDYPYQISNVTELQSMNDLTTYYDDNFILINDIDASDTVTWNGGEGFEPIAPLGTFIGSFNGNGYEITDLYINRPTEEEVGLFEELWESAHIYNVSLINVSIVGNYDVGGIVGEAIDNVLIENIIVTGNISGDQMVGGICGYQNAANVIIKQSYTDCDILAPTNNAGGISARNSGIIDECYAIGVPYSSSGVEGGIVATNVGIVTKSYYDSNTSGLSDIGKGIPKNTTEMQTQSTFVGWDFTNTWVINGLFNYDYPIFQWDAVYYDPVIESPLNNTIFNASYPENKFITFQWREHPSAISSTYVLAKDINYLTVVNSNTITSFNNIISLPANVYYFKVKYNYNDGSESNYTETHFEINSTSADYGTAIQGVVYRTVSGSNTALSGAKVLINNADYTYSDDTITGENGYYLFEDLTEDIYFISASKDGYETSSGNIVNVSDNITYTKDITLEEENAPNYILPHDVRFTVRSLLGGVYEGVTVNVYEGNSATALFTRNTGSDGAVVFKMSETTQYRLTLYSETDGIDTTYTVTPGRESYNIYVSLVGSSQTQQEADTVLYGMHTDGNELNVTWNDTSGLTTLVEVTIKNRDNTTAYYLNSTHSNSYLTQEVNTTANSTYIVELSIESTGLSETFVRSHVISFDTGVKTEFDLGFSAEWQSMFLAALSIIFIAVLFGSANAHLGAILVAVSGLFHVFITGWIPQTILTVAMMFIALIVSVAFYMRKSESIE